MSEIPTSASISDVEAGIEACSRLGADKEKLFRRYPGTFEERYAAWAQRVITSDFNEHI